MRRSLSRLLVTTLLLGVAACRRDGQLGGPGESDRISRNQIVAGTYSTAYDVVQKLHPNWLQPRNGSGANGQAVSQILVYLDGTRYGGTSWLRNIRASTISSIERIDGRTATTRWGSGHGEGVLYVTSLGQPM